ncbi:MAG: ATP-binding cassette domain-containing protein [Bifidobacteriaceae bacterium]|jgi:ABC-type glutathione transport system ATPase component|nr:ATP-binding cassette domain-containing protein [Bifidobacteriaceae bacterium]
MAAELTGRLSLRAEGVGRDYDGAPVLDGVDLALTPGQAPVGVIGPSGSGKTTLVNLLMGWDVQTRGMVAFGADSPYRPRRRMRHHVKAALRGVHEEADPAIGQLTPNGKVLAGARRLAARTSRTCPMDDADLLALVGLELDALDRIPRETSFGERQRFAIALALVTDPDVLIMDEPSTALDPSTAMDVLGAVVAHAQERGAAVLIVSHNLAVIDALTSSVVALYDGREVGRGPLPDLLNHPTHPYLSDLAEIRAAESRPRPVSRPVR